MNAHRFNPVTRIVLNVLGIDSARAAYCPAGEIRRMLWIAAMIVAVGIWQVFIYASALHIALSPDAFRPELLLLAILFSVLLQMAEISLFVRPIWDEQADAYLNSMTENPHG